MTPITGRHEVYWTEDHHGQHDPVHPWCMIWHTAPGTPGEPRTGIRILHSYKTRHEAVMAVARSRAYLSKRATRAREQAAKVETEEYEKMLAVVDAEAPTHE